MATTMGLIYKGLFPSIFTFETLPRRVGGADVDYGSPGARSGAGWYSYCRLMCWFVLCHRDAHGPSGAGSVWEGAVSKDVAAASADFYAGFPGHALAHGARGPTASRQ